VIWQSLVAIITREAYELALALLLHLRYRPVQATPAINVKLSNSPFQLLVERIESLTII